MREMYVGREVVEERRKIRLLQLFKLQKSIVYVRFQGSQARSITMADRQVVMKLTKRKKTASKMYANLITL